jgi:hypothetical protein
VVTFKQLIDTEEHDAAISWNDVAENIADRTNKECRKRWVYGLAPNIQKGRWQKEEDELLVKAVQEHGTKWVIFLSACFRKEMKLVPEMTILYKYM